MKESKLNDLREMFSKCGNGVYISYMDNGRWRISRGLCEVGSRVNWVKCKKILDKNKINYDEGHSGWGMQMSRCIDFNY
jgi:hypothetical protein